MKSRQLFIPCLLLLALTLPGCEDTSAASPAPPKQTAVLPAAGSAPPLSPSPAAPTPAASPTPSPAPSPTPLPVPSAPPTPVPDYWYTGWRALDDSVNAEIGTPRVATMAGDSRPYALLYEIDPTEDGLLLVFVPPPRAEGILQYIEEGAAIPRILFSFNPEANCFQLRLYDTALHDGLPEDHPGADDWVYDWLNEHGVDYATPLSEGPLDTPGAPFDTVSVTADAGDVLLTLPALTGELLLESGRLTETMYPTVRLRLRAAG